MLNEFVRPVPLGVLFLGLVSVCSEDSPASVRKLPYHSLLASGCLAGDLASGLRPDAISPTIYINSFIKATTYFIRNGLPTSFRKYL